MAAVILDAILFPLTLFIGYLIWWLIVLDRGQTPGKQIVGIHAVRAHSGEPLRWGMTFVREFLVKALLFGLISLFTFGVIIIIDNLWPLWDQDKQTLHDKVAGTQVAYIRR